MRIRFTGFSTPFFGASWEYKEQKAKEQEAIELLFIILESKRLIMLPFSRNIDVKFETDINHCSFSTVDLKFKIIQIIERYTLPSDTISILKYMISCCNNLLEDLDTVESSRDNLNSEINIQRDLFLHKIDSFKKEIFPQIDILSEKYKLTFSLPEPERNI